MDGSSCWAATIEASSGWPSGRRTSPGAGTPTGAGHLLAAAIDGGGREGEEVFEILKASAAGRHPTAAMGRHVTCGLLSCGRPDAWEFVEKLLLRARREEGLRQTIL
jgi:hypothetical protein